MRAAVISCATALFTLAAKGGNKGSIQAPFLSSHHDRHAAASGSLHTGGNLHEQQRF